MLDLTTKTSDKYINEYKEMGDDIVAHRYGGMGVIHYAVYRKTTTLSGYSSYASAREIWPDCWLGDITTQELPASINALAGWSPGYWPAARIQAVDAWHASLKQLAQAYVYAAFPDDFASDEKLPSKPLTQSVKHGTIETDQEVMNEQKEQGNEYTTTDREVTFKARLSGIPHSAQER